MVMCADVAGTGSRYTTHRLLAHVSRTHYSTIANGSERGQEKHHLGSFELVTESVLERQIPHDRGQGLV